MLQHYMPQHHVACRINRMPCLAQCTTQMCTTQQQFTQIFQISMHGNSCTKWIFCRGDTTVTRHQSHALLGNFTCFCKMLCPSNSRQILVSLPLTHMYSHSNSRSAYNYLLAVRFTVTASENLGSFAQSQVCSAHSALVTQPICVTTAKQENEPADVSNSAAFCNMRLAWIHNVNPGAQALFVTVCISKRKTPDG